MNIFKYIALIIIGLVIIFWPVILFYDSISFVPHRFTEEWLKAIASGLIIASILWAIQEQFLKKYSKEKYTNTLKSESINYLTEVNKFFLEQNYYECLMLLGQLKNCIEYLNREHIRVSFITSEDFEYLLKVCKEGVSNNLTPSDFKKAKSILSKY